VEAVGEPLISVCLPRFVGADALADERLSSSGRSSTGLRDHLGVFSDQEARQRYATLSILSCAAQLWGSVRASNETVRSAGALPLAMASMIRGDTKASGARNRT
jgi:hypothetical protein